MSANPARAALIAVGDELLSGARADTNSGLLARELARVGIPVVSIEVVSDDEEAVAAAVARALERAQLVLATGGLGPTLDDVTRHGIARALGRELLESAEALAEVRAWFEGRGMAMSATNRRQALLPAGAERVRNRAGTAPGFWLESGGALVIALPGPPRELSVVWSEEILPRLCSSGRAREPIAERRFHLFGLSESLFAERAGEWMARGADPLMGCTVEGGVLCATLRAAGDSERSRERLQARAAEFRRRFAEHVYSEDEPRLEHVLGQECLARGVRVTTAESCTGGLVASLLTGVPGISAVFSRGWVTYGNDAKQDELGLDGALLRSHGAVSREVAEALSIGAAARAGAELALAVTGIAGPDGGSPEKPVGLVYLATSFRGDVRSAERRFAPVGRDAIRLLAARTALFLGWQRLRECGGV